MSGADDEKDERDEKGRREGARRRVTLAEVASALGVSPATVSNAYNHPDQLSASLRERIFEAATRLGYTGPDPAARSLRRQQAGALGVLYADRLSYAFADPAATLFLDGVSAAAEDAGLNLLLIPGAPRERRNRSAVAGAVVDGFLVHSMADDDPLAPAALERGLPVVLVDQPWRADVPYVGIDNTAATRTAGEYALRLGHRRFGVISLRLAPDARIGLADLARQAAGTYQLTRARLAGYRDAFEAAAIVWRDTPVFECAESTLAEGRRAAEALLARVPRPTALVALSDQLALGALEAARYAGLVVPDQLSILGFDDIPAAAQAIPALTTIHQPLIEKGHRAGQLLIAQLRGELAPIERELASATFQALLATELVIRDSTALAPPDDAPPDR